MPDPLREEHLLRAYLESSEDAVVEVCREGKIVRWSRGATRLYGYSEEEMKAHSLAQLVPIYEVPVLEAALEDLRRGEVRRSETTERMRKDGSCVCVTVRKTAIRDEHGQVTGMIESARALVPTDGDSPAERQLRLLVVQMPIMLWTTDRQCGSPRIGDQDFSSRRLIRGNWLEEPYRSFCGALNRDRDR